MSVKKATTGTKGIFFSFVLPRIASRVKKKRRNLKNSLEKYKDSGLQVYLVALEKNDLAKPFIAETHTTLPVLIDRYLVVQKQVGFTGIPVHRTC